MRREICLLSSLLYIHHLEYWQAYGKALNRSFDEGMKEKGGISKRQILLFNEKL